MEMANMIYNDNKYADLVKTYLEMFSFQEPELELKIIGEILENNADKNTYQKVIKWLSEKRPIQYYAGYTYTLNKKIMIDKNVMIPGPEMDIFINTAKKYITDRSGKIIELCTGSGVVSVLLGIEYKDAKIIASDISSKALEVAKKNIELYELDNVELLKGDLFEPFEKFNKDKFDLIVSNPPYAKSDDINNLSSQLKDNAPIISLDGGNDGLCFYRKILKDAPRFLKKYGHVIFENGEEQSEALQELLIENNFKTVEVVYDHINIKRFVVARLEG
jgi:release factor glutamine methyltransferase